MLKNRYSALIPGSSPLERVLRGMGIDTILVAGTKTNVCCESTARDAMMLDFKVVLVEDCCAALSDDEHRERAGKHHPAVRRRHDGRRGADPAAATREPAGITSTLPLVALAIQDYMSGVKKRRYS